MGWDWNELSAFYTSTESLQRALHEIASDDREVRRSARAELRSGVANQGHLFSAAAAVLDVLAARAATARMLTLEELDLIGCILDARDPGLQVLVQGTTVDVAEFCHSRILEILPILFSLATGRDDDYFREISFIVPLFASDTDDVVRILRESVASSHGERRRLAEDALEEALEVQERGTWL